MAFLKCFSHTNLQQLLKGEYPYNITQFLWTNAISSHTPAVYITEWIYRDQNCV